MSEITDLMNGPNYEPVRNDSWRSGRRNGVKWAVEYLHNQAKSMNDPHATQVLNAAAFHLGTDAKSSITDASLADAQRASFVRGEMGNIEADRAETRLTRPCTPASHVDANDDLFDDQIADSIWEAASNGDGRITAVGLRRELTLLGLQIVSKAYHDSIAVERDQLAAKLAGAERERNEVRAISEREVFMTTADVKAVRDLALRRLELESYGADDDGIALAKLQAVATPQVILTLSNALLRVQNGDLGLMKLLETKTRNIEAANTEIAQMRQQIAWFQAEAAKPTPPSLMG